MIILQSGKFVADIIGLHDSISARPSELEFECYRLLRSVQLSQHNHYWEILVR